MGSRRSRRRGCAGRRIPSGRGARPGSRAREPRTDLPDPTGVHPRPHARRGRPLQHRPPPLGRGAERVAGRLPEGRVVPRGDGGHETRHEGRTPLDPAAAIEPAPGKKADGSLRGGDLAEALGDALQESPGEPETASAPTVAPVPVGVPAPKRAGERRIILESDLRSFLDPGGVAKMPVNHTKCRVEWNGSVPQ